MGNLGQLDTEEFQQLIADLGEAPVMYRRHLGMCPRSCSALNGFNVPDPACPVCFGVGEVFADWTSPPDSSTGGLVVAQAARVGRYYGRIKADVGDVSITFIESDYPFAPGDRFLLSSREHVKAELIERGWNGAGLSDRLDYAPASAIDAVVLATGRVTTDYSLAADGSAVVWSGTGVTPAARTPTAPGATYSVVYRYLPVWVVTADSTHHRVRATNGDLFPSTVLARMFQHSDTDQAAGAPF